MTASILYKYFCRKDHIICFYLFSNSRLTDRMVQKCDWFIQVTTFTLLCACAFSYPSLRDDSENMELENLLNEIRKELKVEIEQNQEQRTNYFSDIPLPPHHTVKQQKSTSFGSYNSIQVKDRPLLSVLENRGDNSIEIGMEKRQGSWDYDYGLGGGRFGKRNYGFMDYSLGGGRFGRDIDHVMEMADGTEDFDDVMEG